MAKISFTSTLKRFFPELKSQELEENSLEKALNSLNETYPGLRDYILDEKFRLREHVNIYINEAPLKINSSLNIKLDSNSQVYITQAISGG
jgi:molybdopterin synthase sulfur carrier subunit